MRIVIPIFIYKQHQDSQVDIYFKCYIVNIAIATYFKYNQTIYIHKSEQPQFHKLKQNTTCAQSEPTPTHLTFPAVKSERAKDRILKQVSVSEIDYLFVLADTNAPDKFLDRCRE